MNIAIWGMGISGVSTLKYLTKLNQDKIFLINQGEPSEWSKIDEIQNYISAEYCYSEQQATVDLKHKIDLIVLAPGIDPQNSFLQEFSEVKKICEVELAYSQINIPIIALTGTNGKTTTVTMISEALKSAGNSVFLAGNIGVPLCEIFLDEIEYDYIVLELSSFQLELMDTFRADIAVVLNITKSHMERYKSFDDYKNAKLNIVKHQTAGDLYIAPLEFLSIETKAKKIELTKNLEYDFSKSHLVGDHYFYNIDVVHNILEFYKVQNFKDVVQSLINNFKSIQFRLEYLRSYRSVKIFNDGKSTNTASTLSAVHSFKGKRIGLILGGKLRDQSQDFSELSELKQIQVYAFGEAMNFIDEKFHNVKKGKTLDVLMELVAWDEIDILLFSPAFPSFDLYQNYIHRAKHFDEIINRLDG